MAKIYISSTFSDLDGYRAAVYRILRMLGHDVIAMEDYVATDQRPLDKCLADVANCDLYVGIVAWRYGYIPDQDNPDEKSITEREYRQAEASGVPPLMFLLDDQAKWSKKWKDSHTGEGDGGKRVKDFRDELQRERTISHFKNKDHLAGLVSVAVQKQAPKNAGPQSGFKKVKREALQSQMQLLLEQYKAVAEQLGYELNAGDAVKLRKNLKVLEEEIVKVEGNLRDLGD